MTAQTAKVSFDNSSQFLQDTRREVNLYLAARRTRLKGKSLLFAKMLLAVGLTVSSWTVLMFATPGLLLGLACFLGLVGGALLTGFCVMHDANHGACFDKRAYNHLLGWSSDLLLGFSSYAWRVKHNIAHHTYTNVVDYDDDINQQPFARLAPSQARHSYHRFQHLYMWPLYMLMAIRWQTLGDVSAFRRGQIGQSPLHVPKKWDLAGLLTGKAFFISWAVVLPMFVYPWWLVVIAYLVFTMILSEVMAMTFQLAHCVEEATFASAEEMQVKRVWAIHEVETTVDFCPRNPLLTFLLGGLNYQIEHHLFPRVPHTHYKQIAAIVRRNAAAYGIRYNVQPSLVRALRSHFRHLRTMGRLGLAVPLEMG